MPTAGFVGQLNRELPEVAFLWFVTVHTTPVFRLCSDRVPQTSRGNVYLPYPNMRLSLPGEQEGQTPRVTAIIEDVDQAVEAELRALLPTDGTLLDLDLIASDEIDTPQVAVTGLTVQEIRGDGTSVEIELVAHNLLAMRSPGYAFVPSVTPGLFGV